MDISKKFTSTKEKTIMTQEKSDDIKTIFDSIRNIAICAALILALPSAKELFNGCPELIVTLFTGFSIGAIICLYILNFMWVIYNTKERPKSEAWLYICNLSFTSVITILSAGVATAKVWPLVFNPY